MKFPQQHNPVVFYQIHKFGLNGALDSWTAAVYRSKLIKWQVWHSYCLSCVHDGLKIKNYYRLNYKYFSQGFYCLEGSTQRPTSEFLCPLGHYCEEGTATPHGSPCPAGTAGEQLGQTSRAACKRCREGRFCPAGNSEHWFQWNNKY